MIFLQFFMHKKTEKTPKKTHPSSLSPLDVQSALTDAAAVSRDDSVDVCRRITAKVRAAPRPRDRRSEKKNERREAGKKPNASFAAYLIHQRQVVVIGRHREHEPLFQVQRHLVRVPVLANKRVQGVAVGHPPDEPAVRRERHNRVPRD